MGGGGGGGGGEKKKKRCSRVGLIISQKEKEKKNLNYVALCLVQRLTRKSIRVFCFFQFCILFFIVTYLMLLGIITVAGNVIYVW